MSPGVTFGSRDSLKKSLTVARKSAENGGFRLRCYKNSEAPKNVRTPPSSTKTNNTVSHLISFIKILIQYFLASKRQQIIRSNNGKFDFICKYAEA